MTALPKILIVIGSVRARRSGPQIAQWLAQVGKSALPAEYELVDLREWPLPMDDEPGIPLMGDPYEQEHTKAFSRKITEGNAFIFLAPEYNGGYPAALKNAVDHLYSEWAGKPAIIVSYGGGGGGRSAEQLRQVLGGVKIRLTSTAPGLRRRRDLVGAEPAVEFADSLGTLQKAFGELATLLKS